MCRCRFFAEDDFPAIAACFDEAFADYIMRSTRRAESWLFKRSLKNGVAWDHSVGVYAGDRLVGFTLIGLGEHGGEPCAFDAGTGLVPDYRGRKLAREMFAHALPKLRESGVKRFLLEVLQENEAAVKAYRAAGFKVTRDLDCFKLVLANHAPSAPDPAIRVEPLTRDEPGFPQLLAELRPQLDWEPSWENSLQALRRIPDDLTLLGAMKDGRCVGLLAYYPHLNWILQILVNREERRRGVAAALVGRLVTDLRGEREAISLTNIDRVDAGMAAFLKRMGFEFVISQYEMALDL